MKHIFSVLMAALVCLGAAAQTTDKDKEWSDLYGNNKETSSVLSDDDVDLGFGYATVYYNCNLGAPEGMSMHGVGLELSGLYVGFSPWKDGKLALGLLDFNIDFHFLQKGYQFSVDANSQIVPTPVTGIKNDLDASSRNYAFLFPVGYIHELGKVSCAFFAAPGVGWSDFSNDYKDADICHTDSMWVRKSACFRLNLQAFFWYDHYGIGIRYAFPKGFDGPGMLSAGISFAL